MGQFILKVMIQKLIEAVQTAVSDYFKWKEIAKENKEEAKEIMSEEDPKVRAARMRDFLS